MDSAYVNISATLTGKPPECDLAQVKFPFLCDGKICFFDTFQGTDLNTLKLYSIKICTVHEYLLNLFSELCSRFGCYLIYCVGLFLFQRRVSLMS
jgi:hypothetical protein